MTQIPSRSDHQRRITAARDAVVEAAEEWHARPPLEEALKNRTFKAAAETYKAVSARLDAAVAEILRLRAIRASDEAAAKGKTPTLLLSEIIADACAEPANDGYDQIAEAVYAQIQAAGMVLVPIEPTGKMVNAGQYAVEACDPSTHIQDELRASWKAMIEEAP